MAGQRMKTKINLRLIGMSVVAVIATVLSVTFIFYGLFQQQVRDDLRTDAQLLRAAVFFDAEELEADAADSRIYDVLESGFTEEDGLRATWVDSDGTVLYDSDADAGLLENHAGRPEIEQAFSEGEGESVRRSDTMGVNTFYYAVLLDNGTVLRLSADVNSIFSIFMTVFPVIIFIVIIIIAACALTAHFLTRKLLMPIHRMAENIGDTAHMPVYRELVPVANTIRRQHENILSAARSRQDFTANVSHELKTPLTAISGYAELIESHMVDEEQQTRFAGQIKKNADRLLSLINDIIRLSELDSGDEEALSFEQTDLCETVSSVIDLLKVNADKKRISLTFKGEPCVVRGSKSMIAELADNLCQNAIRYNNEGGSVDVTVKMKDDHAYLTVSDTGIGIPRDMQERVFERFFRVDKSRSKETGGTGLGLAIVKHIVELHDAEIWLDSEPGRGTVVTVKF